MNIKDLIVKAEDLSLMFDCGIYMIYHKQNPNKFYIGSAASKGKRKHTSGIYIRWLKHLNELKYGTHHSKYLQNIVNKYGIDGLRFKIVEICLPDICIQREQYYLDTLNPVFNSCKIAGNSSGYKHTLETKKKMSDQRIGKKRKPMSLETKKKISNSAKKRDLSYLRTPEILEKKSKKLKGKALPDFIYKARRKPVQQLDKNGKLIREYISTKEASFITKIDRASINKAALGQRPTAGGFKWVFKYPKEAKALGFSQDRLVNNEEGD
jgi:group I intron endonuclease